MHSIRDNCLEIQVFRSIRYMCYIRRLCLGRYLDGVIRHDRNSIHLEVLASTIIIKARTLTLPVFRAVFYRRMHIIHI